MIRKLPAYHPKYRPDIDGLRAVAVLGVIGFHAFPAQFKGGFIGVDIFFVISGYLISSIIFENLDKGTFSFSEFYSRRIRRIFPALLIVLITCFIFGWISLLPIEFKQLGKHIAGGAGFISNFLLWNEAGYFDNSAESKPLLHLWSLGIEEQFYIFWPLLLWVSWRQKFNLLFITIVIVCTTFIFNIKGVEQDMVATFYSPQSRFWELLSGSLLAWGTLYKQSELFSFKRKIKNWIFFNFFGKNESNDQLIANVFSFVGLALLLYGFWKIDRGFSFPGVWALIPVIGAMLIIIAGPESWLNRTVLSNRVLVWLGLISFPLYLWHWPLLAFTRIIQGVVPSPYMRIGTIACSIFLAWLTYRFVECPIRFGANNRVKVVALILSMAIVGFGGYCTFIGNGLSFRNVVKINVSLDSGSDGWAGVELVDECGIPLRYIEIQKRMAVCTSDSRSPLRYALVGDSKAAAIFSGLVRTSTNDGRWLFIGGNGPNGAPVPVISDRDIYKKYQTLSMTAINAVASNKKIEKVVLVAATRTLFQLSNDIDIQDLPASENYLAALEGLKNTIEILKGSGKKVILVVDNPTLPHPEDCLYRKTSLSLVNNFLVKDNPKCILSLDAHLSLSSRYRDLLEEIKSDYPNDVVIFDTIKYLCDLNKRECTHTKDGRFLYSYTDHISDYAAGLIGRDLNKALNTR